jgi:hypothetical protein
MHAKTRRVELGAFCMLRATHVFDLRVLLQLRLQQVPVGRGRQLQRASLVKAAADLLQGEGERLKGGEQKGWK